MADNSTARQLILHARRASLGTILSSSEPSGVVPYVSLVTVAAIDATTIVTLLSGLAKHTQNLNSHTDCSLLITDEMLAAGEDPMAAARITLTTVAERLPRAADAESRSMFLELHPAAAMYADFDDFAFYQMRVVEAHLVAGFGRIQTLTADQLREA